LEARGLKLNEEKTRLADSRQGFDFLGFRVRWQPSRTSGKRYAHVEASPRSQQRLREAVRSKLNHWTLGKRIPEALAGVNYQPAAEGLGGLLPLPQQQSGNGEAQLACAQPGTPVAVAQAREDAGTLGRLPGSTAPDPVRSMALASPGRVARILKGEPQCSAMKRPGKLDTGNPFVRFDEGWVGKSGR
jgi:hypothetical protein